MKITKSPTGLYITLNNPNRIWNTVPNKDNTVMIDYDKAHEPVGIEILGDTTIDIETLED